MAGYQSRSRVRHSLVVGDVNSTLACALVAAKHNVPVVHVEAGLRSFDRTMPEEINRVLTDQLSDYLFTTARSARSNLELEGVAAERIHFVGNVMVDTLQEQLPRALPGRQTLRDVRAPDVVVSAPRYAVLTLHRPSNVDDRSTLSELLDAIVDISRQIPVIWPLHPRTRARIEEFNLADALRAHAVVTIGPLGYICRHRLHGQQRGGDRPISSSYHGFSPRFFDLHGSTKSAEPKTS